MSVTLWCIETIIFYFIRLYLFTHNFIDNLFIVDDDEWFFLQIDDLLRWLWLQTYFNFETIFLPGKCRRHMAPYPLLVFPYPTPLDSKFTNPYWDYPILEKMWRFWVWEQFNWLNPSSVWIRGVGRTRQGEADELLGLAVGRASWGGSYQERIHPVSWLTSIPL